MRGIILEKIKMMTFPYALYPTCILTDHTGEKINKPIQQGSVDKIESGIFSTTDSLEWGFDMCIGIQYYANQVAKSAKAEQAK